MAGEKLYLFDIDGTLGDTSGAGLTSLNEATLHFFQKKPPAFDLAGATDLSLIKQLEAYFQVAMSAHDVAAFFAHYESRLEWNFSQGNFPWRVHQGAVDLLDFIAARNGASVGLLTGNTRGGAAIKVRHFGVAHHFHFGAYGCDEADRNLLGPIALQRANQTKGKIHSAADTWVIGDTPKDVLCAKAMGARCLAVTTGYFSQDVLLAAGADIAVDSLEQAIDLI
ncbi:MAG: HAD family hydrolase [Verrucomicrobia bacterium]|nr:MAG: HAD family hydrolase [Verrucomicrobiota bacterium]